jgi:hypothetical protein
MFRHCWVIFREKLSVVVTVGCTIQLSENVLLTVHCAAYGGLSENVLLTVHCAAYGGANSLWSRLVQCTVNSTFSLNCIVQPSVRTTESFSLRMTQQGRNI